MPLIPIKIWSGSRVWINDEGFFISSGPIPLREGGYDRRANSYHLIDVVELILQEARTK